MNINLLFVCLCMSCYQGTAQTKIDSLTEVRTTLIQEDNESHQEIEKVEKEIIADILRNGYEMTVESTYQGQTFDLRETGIGGNKIADIKAGDRITVIGKESIYFKVKFGELVGLLYLSTPDYPLSLLNDYKYRDQIEVREVPYKSSNPKSSNPKKSVRSGSNCSSSQCTGHTQKGNRCRNRTTNCSGRCHYH